LHQTYQCPFSTAGTLSQKPATFFTSSESDECGKDFLPYRRPPLTNRGVMFPTKSTFYTNSVYETATQINIIANG